jgi:5-methylcytosine-specific restriction endonuclease McrA
MYGVSGERYSPSDGGSAAPSRYAVGDQARPALGTYMADFLFITDPDFSPEKVGRSKSSSWSCSKSAQPNDRAFVYVTGQGISFEWVLVGRPRPDAHWRFQCSVRLFNEMFPPITMQELRKAIPRSVWAPPHTGLRGYRSISVPPKAAAAIRASRGMLPNSLEALEAQFRKKVATSRNQSAALRQARLARAPRVPQAVSASVIAFIRNPDVAAEVLERAAGRCERCKAKAPFRRASDNTPYLEVHHIIRLADGGEDTVDNAVALCPNCHRKSHYGKPLTQKA